MSRRTAKPPEPPPDPLPPGTFVAPAAECDAMLAAGKALYLRCQTLRGWVEANAQTPVPLALAVQLVAVLAEADALAAAVGQFRQASEGR